MLMFMSVQIKYYRISTPYFRVKMLARIVHFSPLSRDVVRLDKLPCVSLITCESCLEISRV